MSEHDAREAMRGWIRAIANAASERFDDTTAVAGGGLERLGRTAAGLWALLGDIGAAGFSGKVTIETTLSELLRLLPEDARDAIGAVAGDPMPVVVTYDTAARVARVDAHRVALKGVCYRDLAASELRFEELRLRVEGTVDSLTVAMTARRVLALDVSYARTLQGSAATLEIEGLAVRADELSPDAARIDDPLRPIRARLEVDVFRLRDAAAGTVAVERFVARTIRAELDQGGEQATLDVARVEVIAPSQGEMRAGRAELRGLRGRVSNPGGGLPLLDRKPDHPEAHVFVATVHVEHADSPFGRAAAIAVDELTVSVDTTSAEVAIGLATADEVSGPLDARAKHVEARVVGARIEHDEPSARIGRLDADEASARPALDGAGHLPLDEALRAGGGLVRDAELSASAALSPGSLPAGPIRLGVEPGTRAEIEAAVQAGRIVPERTEIRFEGPLDGPLWTTVRGARLTEEGRVKARVGGLPDPYVTSQVARELGLERSRIPLSVDVLAERLADRLDEGYPDDRVEAITAIGRARLAGHAAVAGAEATLTDLPGTNELRFEGELGGHLVAETTRVLAEAVRAVVGSFDFVAGEAEAEGVRVDMGEDRVDASARHLRANDVVID